MANLHVSSPTGEPRQSGGSTVVGNVGLTRRDFFADVVEQLRRELPDPLADFSPRANSMLLKVSYQNERIHYEVAVNSAAGTMEVGLHFEDGPVSTAAYLAWFDARIVELKHKLGPTVELERWTASWGHLYEIVPLPRLETAVAKRTAARLAVLIAALQPLVDAAAIPPERAAQPEAARGPWRGRRASRG